MTVSTNNKEVICPMKGTITVNYGAINNKKADIFLTICRYTAFALQFVILVVFLVF